MVMAVIVSMLVIYLFFGEWKASLIVGTSIPISILTALVLMRAMGLSLNVITMSSLVLGVGMMVDNSIVVLESCFRSTKHTGLIGYREAALEGSGLVLESIVGSTVTTCVVFLPLALLSGMSGQMFKPLGFTIIFCMSASLISAMTIVPLCYCTYRPIEKEKSPAGMLVVKMQDAYRALMPKLLNRKKTVIVVSVLLLAGSFLMAKQLKFELIPDVDQGQIQVTIETRPGLKVEEVDKILMRVEEVVKNEPDVENYLITFGGSGLSISSDDATMMAYLKDDRKRKTATIVREWEREMNKIDGVNITVESSSNLPSLIEDHDLEYILESTKYDELKEVSDQVANALTQCDEVTKVHTTLENAAPVVKVRIDAIKANAEFISPIQVVTAVNNMIDGIEAASLDVDGNDTSIYVEFPKGEYDTIDRLKGIVLTNNIGTSVALSDIADITFKDSPTTIERYDKQYRVTISGDLMTDDEREMTAITNRLYDEVVSKYLTSSISRATNLEDTTMKEEFIALFGAIATAVFLVFVVMASQFESPKYSLMVMTTIPFALIGSFGLLYIADVSISMVSLLGFLMLSGTVVNNGILYVDTANQYRRTMDKTTALIEAGATRLRPILMTTLTTIVSMIPMCLAYGDSGEIMQGLALVDVGGLLASTVLALLLLPVYYSMMTPEAKKEPSYD
jgi:multidrug efflux pump subunit AcrB